ncbi:TPA: OmpP1/FadL family transporter [Pseudomonas aeruginosa]|uniref:OmpP1/FadL family transporter n=1 Tax=Pseudomonas aeruginosa TaxID=287 RepID=UPI000BB6F7D4|nr:outer membrane protein transport protein [Pseudomonas aeruginosa]MBH4508318.1 outer membrane protein transport protein [Pseudomonas aeruginosa]MCT0747817.1 outer membrane protein transport protein [Pseudomonas aeruginosa]PBW54161.1 Long-chain fatty acid transport protein [Pseudomonas aeruginosa]HBO3191814.1 outer membrane protein transport protein [Pseudomonas aeruginosa]HBO4618038.1 outer membrane protein transport protein [Pseudomonas aeruginosa]
MKKKLLKSSTALAVILESLNAFAGGFALNEQSISGMGVGFAGRSSAADDASTVFGNPAGMARLKSEEVSVGAATLFAKSDISQVRSSFGGTQDGDMVPTTTVPMGYYVKPIDEHWTFGVGFYAPFGLITDYSSGYAGRYYANKSQVTTLTFQPTVSYSFNEKISIGFGPTINRISGELSAMVPNPLSPGRNDGELKSTGDDTALGFNTGVLVQATDRTRLGLTYHSRVSYHLDAKSKVTDGIFSLLGVSGRSYNASLDVDTPESVDFSVTRQLNNDWTLYVGSTWTRWSRFKELTVENRGLPPSLSGQLGTITAEENWHDTWAHAVGVAYQLNNQWVLRAGFSVDQSPTNNTNRDPRIPTGDRKVVSFGAGWTPARQVTIDVAYSYLWEESIKVNDTSATQGDYSAKYKNSANGLGISVGYRF